jgi:epoxyqueuosine reductase QueG
MAAFSNKIQEVCFLDREKSIVEILYKENDKVISYHLPVDFNNQEFQKLISEYSLEKIELSTKNKYKSYKKIIENHLKKIGEGFEKNLQNDNNAFFEKLEKFIFNFDENLDDEMLFKLKLKMFETDKLKNCIEPDKKSKIRLAKTPLELFQEYNKL